MGKRALYVLSRIGLYYCMSLRDTSVALVMALRYTYSLSILAYLGLATVVFNRSICPLGVKFSSL